MKRSRQDNFYYELASKWVAGTILPEEKETFLNWYKEHSDDPLSVPGNIAQSEVQHRARLLKQIRKQILKEEHQGYARLPYKLIAACALILLAIGIFLYKNANQQTGILKTTAPGYAATLTLSDGSVVSLDNIEAGAVVEQPGISITKQEDGLITYKLESTASTGEEPQYNTISTPPGGQYQIVLPDGTKVWLNAASTLVYPTAFESDQRKVTLTGEGYFEVAHDAKRPFHVATEQQEIVVLGTHFNINAYQNENSTKTTLIQGSVKVIPNAEKGKQAILSPGQQFKLTKDNQTSISNVDLRAAIAWKSGVFSFNDSNIASVVRELARWYNVEISYQGTRGSAHLWGEIGRDVEISEALDILKYFDYHFEIEGGQHQKIIIYNNKK